ncbi:MAG: cytochrome c biogenesis protein ResB [Pseudolysinimonas sp.]|uniref:cytochrome c biogenesis protein ResB n=1 Tax=Pseudolysinimonas sp. TaxID=2680009 RepID=UPI003267300D
MESRPAENPRLGPIGFARFLWRQLTSMRTALVLLLMLALAAVPGSLVPQRSSDPNGVLQYQAKNPDLFKVLDSFGLFSTFSSPWFAAIYLLLFVSLIGCIIPRARHHFEALIAKPPKTPARLARLVGFTELTTTLDAETAVLEARRVLKAQGYRVERYGDSISGERGYLRETGNLVFHTALVGVLASVAIGGGLGYTGQRVLLQDEPFTNVLADYDSFHPGTWFDQDTSLAPFSLRLDHFDSVYSFESDGVWHPRDFTASLSTRTPGGDWAPATLKVNSPLEIGGAQVYLQGNGYAPVVSIRNPAGVEVYRQAVPFLALDGNLRSGGVVKVTDGLSAQLGMQGFFYPDPYTSRDGSLQSFSPNLGDNALLTLLVYRGDLGVDEGRNGNVYNLDTTNLQQIAGATDALTLTPGQIVDLPDGMGSIELVGVARYIGIDIHHDPTQLFVLGFVIAAVLGLLTSLFISRRRMWIKVTPGSDGSRLEYAGLARGEDAGLASAVTEMAQAHADALERRMSS